MKKAWPYYGEEEIKAAVRVLRSGRVNQWTGKEVFAFEKEYAKSLGVPYAVALSNGSVALDTALEILGIESGDEVIVPAHSFIATAACVALRGARPVFADIEPDTGNLSVDSVRQLITRRTKAVIAVHIYGWPCEIRELRRLCDQKRLFLVEDCAQAHGARFEGRPVGSFGDVACFSFCQDKIISTAGEGGLLAMRDKGLWKKAWSYKDHGRSHSACFSSRHSFGFRWLIEGFGTNYRMTEIQGAIGRIMLKKLEGWGRHRRSLAGLLDEGIGSMPGLKVVATREGRMSSYYRYYAHVDPERLKKGWSRDRIVAGLLSRGVSCGTSLCPEIYLERAFLKEKPRPRRLPAARIFGKTAMTFYVHPQISEERMCLTLDKVRRWMREASQ